MTFDELAAELRPAVQEWADAYKPVHAVAHWDDRQRKGVASYDQAFEEAARSAESLLGQAGSQLAPKFLDLFPAIVWEDQDECLEVRPEDIST